MDKLDPTVLRTSTKLMVLADHIEAVDPSSFHMGTWYEEWTGKRDHAPACGFIACAAGHAALLFQGLEVKPNHHAGGSRMFNIRRTDHPYMNACEAVRTVLGLRDYEAQRLLYPTDEERVRQFGGQDCDTPKAVAWHFRQYARIHQLREDGQIGVS